MTEYEDYKPKTDTGKVKSIDQEEEIGCILEPKKKTNSRASCRRCGSIGHYIWNCDQKFGGYFNSDSGSDKDGNFIGKSVVCVKKGQDLKKVEEVEDCFILEFDPFKVDDDTSVEERKKKWEEVKMVKDAKKVGKKEDGKVKFPTKIGKKEDGSDDVEMIRSIVCVKKKEDVKKVEEVEDCFILEFDPNEPVEFSNLSLSVSKSESITVIEEDLTILAEKGQMACRDYPHARNMCAKHPFKTTAHEIHCEKCYCYVCDVPAPCTFWTGTKMHCDASHEISTWREIRELLYKR